MIFNEIFPNLKADKYIDRAISSGFLSHAYLFLSEDDKLLRAFSFYIAEKILKISVSDSSKTHAMVEAKSHPDLFFYPKELGGKILVADSNEISEQSQYKPSMGQNKVFVLDGLQNMNEGAQNKLLKVLEEPPINTYFLLTAKSKNSVLQTVRSRSTEFTLEQFSEEEMIRILTPQAKDEEKLRLAVLSSSGNLSRAAELLTEENMSVEFSRALDTLSRLKSSKDVLSVVSNFNGKEDKIVFGYMQMLFRDMLVVKQNAKRLVYSKKYLDIIEKMEKNYSALTLIESVDVISRAFDRMEVNINSKSNVDKVLLELLEVKFNCQ